MVGARTNVSGRAVPWFLAAAAGLLGVEAFVSAQLSLVGAMDLASWAAAADIGLGIPLLAYALLVRRGGGSPLLLLPTFVFAVAAVHVIAPAGPGVRALAVLAGIAESAIIVLAIWRVRQLRRAYVELLPLKPYALDAAREATRRTFGRSRAVEFLFTEITLFTLALRGPLLRADAPPGARLFTQGRGYLPAALALLGLMCVEVPLVHLVVGHWSPFAAWLLTGLSVYSAAWIAGDAQAIRLQPHALTGQMLHLRVGLRSAADIPLEAVLGARRFDDLADREVVRMVAMGTPRLVMELGRPVEVRGLFGARTEARAVAFTADDEAAFLDAVRDARWDRDGSGAPR